MDNELRAIVFTKVQKALIKEVLEAPEFNHIDWSSENLENLRSSIRNHYRKEQNFLCCYCKNQISVRNAANSQVEHIAPKSKYKRFIFTPKNLCVVCVDCNNAKRDIDVVKPLPLNKERTKYPSSSQFLIIHPHFDIYDEHLRKFGERFYFSLTEKGSCTYSVCKLNKGLADMGYFDSEDILSDMELMAQIMDAKLKKDTKKLKILKKLLIESI
ncbi:HNH endonuclease [Pseudoalteromonas espejiana]